VTAFDEALAIAKAELEEDAAAGKWQPEPADALFECEFIRAGFRSYGLEAPDKSWRLTVSRLDFGARDPSALLEVHAPNHEASFPDLGNFVFSHAVGVNGGTNFNQCVKRLHATLGGAELDWQRRITYLIARAKDANAGGGNGTFFTRTRPHVETPPPFVFANRIRQGRTMSIFGPGSAGKTTFVDGLIVAACTGTEVIPGWWPTRQYRCLVLDWDEGREEEEIRLAAICNAYDVDLPGGYHYKRMSRPLSDVADAVGTYVVDNGIEIVIVSPVGRAQRDHGDNLTAPIDELYEVLRSFATTNILIDHVTGANMKGGAEREFGSVRKRDNARGSYSLYPQTEGIGERTIVIRNMKADAMAPKAQPQAIRIEYDPPEGAEGIYEKINFYPDEIADDAPLGMPIGGVAMRVVIHDALLAGHLTIEQLAGQTGYNTGSVKACLYRYKESWFSRLPSGAWEALPVAK
jgi:hypothetical protein